MDYITTKLQPLKSYPTYQFHAFTASKTLSSDEAFIVCILETFRWLRARLKSYPKLPAEIVTPEPENYKDFSLKDLNSFSFSMGLNVDVVYAEKRGVWAFHISEPDMGANKGKSNERPPVNGRIFETDIAFVKLENCVEAGIRTICSEPFDTEAPCEVFRPTVVKALAENRDIGFIECGFRIDGSPLVVSSKGDAEHFGSLYENPEFDMPLILIADTVFIPPKKPEINPDNIPALHDKSLSRINLEGMSFANEKNSVYDIDYSKVNIEKKPVKNGISATSAAKMEIETALDKNRELKKELHDKIKGLNSICVNYLKSKEQKPPCFPYQEFAKSVMGFAVVCFVEEKCFKLLKNKHNIDIKSGDIIICSHGAELDCYSYSDYSATMDKFKSSFRKAVNQLPKRRAYSFGGVMFSTDARLIELHDKRHETDNLEEQCELYRQEITQLRKQVQNFLQQNTDMQINADTQRMTAKKLKNAENELESLKVYIENQKEMWATKEETYRKSAELVSFYKKKADIAAGYPLDKNEICEWTDKNFADTLIVTQSARAEMRKYDGALDTAVMCDGILFLDAYAKYLRGEISEDELGLYAERYNWEAQNCGKVAIRMNKEDYLATYDGERHLMDMHIKYGVKSQVLIRIYFCYNSKLKKIIIGHMPEHLATANQTT